MFVPAFSLVGCALIEPEDTDAGPLLVALACALVVVLACDVLLLRRHEGFLLAARADVVVRGADAPVEVQVRLVWSETCAEVRVAVTVGGGTLRVVRGVCALCGWGR